MVKKKLDIGWDIPKQWTIKGENAVSCPRNVPVRGKKVDPPTDAIFLPLTRVWGAEAGAHILRVSHKNCALVQGDVTRARNCIFTKIFIWLSRVSEEIFSF